MKRNVLIWGLALVLVIAAVIVTAEKGKSNTQVPSADGASTVQNSTAAPLDNTVQGNGNSEKEIDFTLKDLDGNKVSLSSFLGKNVYLNFFATWCPPCRGEMPDIQKMYDKYKDKDFVVLAVDLGEDSDTVKKFVKDNGYTFKVLLDSDQSVGQQYQTYSIPVSIFIDKNGSIVTRRVGALSKEQMETYIKALIERK